MALEVRGLVKNFAGVQAVCGIDLQVRPGECVALIGPNGAGKSTTFACIAGQQAVTSGNVMWCGESLVGLSPAGRLRRGVARTFQVAQTFEALPVWQNVALLLQNRQGLPAFQTLDARHADAALKLLARVGLKDAAQQLAGSLPYGAKKRLELSMALAGIDGIEAGAASQPTSTPRLLLLDEPAAGLAAAERQSLMRLVRSLVRSDRRESALADGLAVLYTEHNMDAVFGVADRVLVLMEGRIVAQGGAAEVAQDPQVQQRYLGSSWQAHAALARGAHA